MALSTLLPTTTTTSGHSDDRRRRHHHHQNKRKKKPPPSPSPPPRTPPQNHTMAISKNTTKNSKKPTTTSSTTTPTPTSSWKQLKSLLSCRSAAAAARVHDPAASSALARLRSAAGPGGACGASLCAIRDVVDAASSAASSAAVSDRDTAPLTRSSRRAHHAVAGSAHASQPSLRGLSGCYECRAINVEPMSRRYPRPRELCACSECGEVFTKAESLEHHQAIRHAVSELGPEDSGRNIVEIIFKSSWQKRDHPICQIERILKVHNPQRTIARFEAYRDAVKSRSRATTARAAADGNELLRFHSVSLACPLGLHGSTSLCSASNVPNQSPPAGTCGVCTTIRHGFAPLLGAHPLGVRTTASSGRAHDCAGTTTMPPLPAAASSATGRRAMLVCRVIAGRVRRSGDTVEEPFDSVAGDAAAGGVCGNLEELFVANPRAILPCFVVIYRALD